MVEQKHQMMAARAIVQAFSKGIPFLKFGDGAEALVLAYRKTGEVIEDPDSKDCFEVLESGVFKRCIRQRGDERSYTYLRFSSLEPEQLQGALSSSFESLPFETMEILPMDAAFQSMQWEEAQSRSDLRMAER